MSTAPKVRVAPDSDICIVMMSALGDAVHVLPVVNALRRNGPCRLTWVLEPAAARLMRGHPWINEVLIHEGGAAGLLQLRRQLRGRRYDLLIDLQVALKAGLTTAAIPARTKLGFDKRRARDANWLFTNARIPGGPDQHVQDQYLEFVRHLGIAVPEPEWNLGPWPGEERLADSFMPSDAQPVAALAIATSRDEKDWIPERWAELASALHHEHGLTPLLVGGSSAKERRIAHTITDLCTVPVRSALGSSLRELVCVLARSALVVSPDTAPLHMSVALGVPVISLMGYTNPLRVGPYKRFHDLMVDAYSDPGEVLQPSLEYRPGRMLRISVGDVLERVRIWETRYRG